MSGWFPRSTPRTNSARPWPSLSRQRLPEARATALRFTKANFVAAERMSLADVVELESERHIRIVARPGPFSERARALQQRSAP